MFDGLPAKRPLLLSSIHCACTLQNSFILCISKGHAGETLTLLSKHLQTLHQGQLF